MKLRLQVGLFLVISGTAALAADPAGSIRSAMEGCRARQAAQAPRVGPIKDGVGFVKTQELDAQYRLELPDSASMSEPMTAQVEIATALVSATAPTEEAVKQIPLSVDGPNVIKMVRRYRFEWGSGHWWLTDATINLTIKMPGMSMLPMRDKKVDLGSARTGFDAGGSCVQAIESA